MRRRIAVQAGLSALVCAAACGAGAAGAQAQTTSWAPTATRAVPTGSGVTETGPLSGSTPVTVQVVLGLRDAATAQQDIAAGDTMSVASFDARFAPTSAQVSAVDSYLRSEGVTPTAVTPNNTIITATGPAAAIQAAFNTTLDRVSAKSGSGYANLTAASVPATLSSTVTAVLGLNDVFTAAAPAATNPARTCTIAAVGYPCTYNPQGFWKAYDATAAPTGVNTSEAIFAEGALSGVVSDLRTEEKANGLPQVPVTIDQTGAASTDTSGADEWDLDTQYSTGMADKVADLTLYDASTLDDSDTAIEFADFANDSALKAGSASFGECEFEAYLDGSMTADDQSFEQAALEGKTVFASAGDTGGFCSVGTPNGVPAGLPDVNYPASSPYVVGVGGTTLITSSTGAYAEEIAWLAGGGGISYFEHQPTWQKTDGVVGTLAGVANLRTLPDVSMDADPNSGANVYVNGTPEGVGGTSLSSPLALGVWDRIESAHSESVGFASPLLYAANGSAAFHDITLGDTGPYPATRGYDLATGIGTFDVARAISIIK